MPTKFSRFVLTFWNKGKYLLCLVIPPLIILLPVVMQYPFPQSSSQYSDMAISHFPNAYFLAESLSRWKSIPLWSPTILSGYPFAANPLSGLWYLPNWLAVILPLPIGINLLIIAHLIWGGAGVYYLLKGEGISQVAALFGGLAFELMPKLFAHYGAGHVSLISAVCWTPWLIVSAQRIWDKESEHLPGNISFARSIVFPSVILSSIILADVRWIGFAALLWITYLVIEWGKRTSRIETTEKIENRVETRTIRSLIGNIAIPILVASGLAAPFLLPFFEYVQLSTRSHLTSVDNLVFSLPPAKILGLIFPPFGDYYEWIVYPGIMVTLLAGLSWTIKNHAKYKTYWTAVFVATLTFALGSSLPGSSWLAEIPGISLMRVPSRIIFLSGLALVCLAARGLDGIIQGKLGDDFKAMKLILVALVGFLLLLNIGAAWITAQFVKNLVWSLIFGSLGAVIIWRLIHRKQPMIWIIAIFSICIIEWMAVDTSLFSSRRSQDVFSSGEDVANYLAKDKDIFRVYSPSYSLPQQVAVVNHIELADGVDPLQLDSYVDFMEEASGVRAEGYSVTLPSYKTGDPATDNQDAKPNPELLGLLNVKYVVAEYDINVEGLKYLAKYDQSRLYLNQSWLPRAWLQPSDEPVGKNISSVAEILWSPNHIQIAVGHSNESQQLVLSELVYPGWHVTVDGQERQIEAVQGILRSVEILPGDKTVEFRFQPLSLFWGLMVCLITIILVAGNLIYYGYRKQQ